MTNALLALLLVVLAFLVMRAITRERREYSRFKRLRSSSARQKVYRKWLLESFVMFGGLSAAVLLAATDFIQPALVDARSWPPIAWMLEGFSGDLGMIVGGLLSVAFIAALLLPLLLMWSEHEEIPTVGDIRALLPRNKQEVWYGAGLSVNAGIFEELLFRLALPALIFGIVGNGVLAFALTAVLFGVLHIYQGPIGVAASVLLGVVFTLVYVMTGSILVAIAAHVLIDLRSLVLIPLVLMRVQRKQATVN